MIANDGRPVERPTARVWVATGRDEAPFATTTARLEAVGIPGRSEAAAGGVRKIYVARFDVPRPGKYWLLTEPAGARIQAVSVFEVQVRLPVPVFRGNDPSKGYNRWMREWGLTSEPWTFLVGPDGRIKAEFQGSVSAAELSAAIRQMLGLDET